MVQRTAGICQNIRHQSKAILQLTALIQMPSNAVVESGSGSVHGLVMYLVFVICCFVLQYFPIREALGD